MRRLVCAGVSVCLILSNQLPLQASTPIPSVIEINRSLEVPGSDPAGFRLPPAIGEIQEIYQGSAAGTVILVQDAHAVDDAQKNIRNIIRHFEKRYGVRQVALEGASGTLDPLLLKTFPDKEVLSRVLNEYRTEGALTGPVAAAIASDSRVKFQGIEDWKLYEEGIGWYLRAMEKQKAIQDRLAALGETLNVEKEKTYPRALLEIDKGLEKFEDNRSDMLEVLASLAAVKAPPEGSELELLVSEGIVLQGAKTLDGEIRRIAEQVRRYLNEKPGGSLGLFNEKYQAYQTGNISADAFALFLKELVVNGKLPVKVSKALGDKVRRQKRMADIKGTKLFADFEAYAQAVKESLFENDGNRELDQRTRELRLLKRFNKLELSQTDWGKMNAKGDSPRTDVEDFAPHFAFYKNATRRDEALFANLKKMLANETAKGGRSRVLAVAGGFHTQGLTRKLEEAGISYVLVTPRIDQILDLSRYQSQMRGNVPWKKYFRAVDGKIQIHDAFMRSTRDKLLASMDMKGAVKHWRDEIIRSLAASKRLDRAGDYTKWIDEAAGAGEEPQEALAQKVLSEAKALMERFRLFTSRRDITEQNILKLMSAGTAPQWPTCAQILKPGGGIGLPSVAVLEQAVSSLRPEIRQVTETEALDVAAFYDERYFNSLRQIQAYPQGVERDIAKGFDETPEGQLVPKKLEPGAYAIIHRLDPDLPMVLEAHEAFEAFVAELKTVFPGQEDEVEKGIWRVGRENVHMSWGVFQEYPVLSPKPEEVRLLTGEDVPLIGTVLDESFRARPPPELYRMGYAITGNGGFVLLAVDPTKRLNGWQQKLMGEVQEKVAVAGAREKHGHIAIGRVLRLPYSKIESEKAEQIRRVTEIAQATGKKYRGKWESNLLDPASLQLYSPGGMHFIHENQGWLSVAGPLNQYFAFGRGRTEMREEAVPLKDVTITGISPEMLKVVTGEIVKWSPGQKRVNISLVRPHDPEDVKQAKAANEIQAVEAIWARVMAQINGAEPLYSPSVIDAAGQLIQAIKESIHVKFLKGEFAVAQELSDWTNRIWDDEAFLRGQGLSPNEIVQQVSAIMHERFLPALVDREEIFYLDREIAGLPPALARQHVVDRQKEILMIKLFEVLLNLPYGFNSKDENVIAEERKLATARRTMIRTIFASLSESIDQGASVRKAVQAEIKKLRGHLQVLEKSLDKAKQMPKATPEERAAREQTLYTSSRNVESIQELIGMLQGVIVDHGAYDYFYEFADPAPVKNRKWRAERNRHRNALKITERFFPLEGDQELQSWVLQFDRFIKDETGKGRTVDYAVSKFFYAQYAEFQKLGTARQDELNPEMDLLPARTIDFVMRYYDIVHNGDPELQAKAADPVVVFAETIRHEGDLNRLLGNLRGREILAIVAPRQEGEFRIPHWFIFAKKRGIVVVPAADFEAAGLTFEQIPAGGLALVDGKTGDVILHPSEETVDLRRKKAAIYEHLEAYFWYRAKEPVEFEGRPVIYFNDETNIFNLRDVDGIESIARRSGGAGVGLLRLEELMIEMDRHGIQSDDVRLGTAIYEILASRFLEGRARCVIRLFDVAGDKRPQFLLESGWEDKMQDIMNHRTGVRFYLDQNPQYAPLREFGKRQLKAIFDAHLLMGGRSGAEILLSDVRNAQEVQGAEVLIQEAIEEYLADPNKAKVLGLPPDVAANMRTLLETLPVGYMFEDTLVIENEREAIFKKMAEMNQTHPKKRFIGIGSNDLMKSIMRERLHGRGKLRRVNGWLIHDLWRVAEDAKKYGFPVNLEGEAGNTVEALLFLLVMQYADQLEVTPVAATNKIPEIREYARKVKKSYLQEPISLSDGSVSSLEDLILRCALEDLPDDDLLMEAFQHVMDKIVRAVIDVQNPVFHKFVEARMQAAEQAQDRAEEAQQDMRETTPQGVRIYHRDLGDRTRIARAFTLDSEGLHARPTHALAKIAFNAGIAKGWLIYGDEVVDLKDTFMVQINLLALGIPGGQKIVLAVEGEKGAVQKFFEDPELQNGTPRGLLLMRNALKPDQTEGELMFTPLDVADADIEKVDELWGETPEAPQPPARPELRSEMRQPQVMARTEVENLLSRIRNVAPFSAAERRVSELLESAGAWIPRSEVRAAAFGPGLWGYMKQAVSDAAEAIRQDTVTRVAMFLIGQFLRSESDRVVRQLVRWIESFRLSLERFAFGLNDALQTAMRDLETSREQPLLPGMPQGTAPVLVPVAPEIPLPQRRELRDGEDKGLSLDGETVLEGMPPLESIQSPQSMPAPDGMPRLTGLAPLTPRTLGADLRTLEAQLVYAHDATQPWPEDNKVHLGTESWQIFNRGALTEGRYLGAVPQDDGTYQLFQFFSVQDGEVYIRPVILLEDKERPGSLYFTAAGVAIDLQAEKSIFRELLGADEQADGHIVHIGDILVYKVGSDRLSNDALLASSDRGSRQVLEEALIAILPAGTSDSIIQDMSEELLGLRLEVESDRQLYRLLEALYRERTAKELTLEKADWPSVDRAIAVNNLNERENGKSLRFTAGERDYVVDKIVSRLEQAFDLAQEHYPEGSRLLDIILNSGAQDMPEGLARKLSLVVKQALLRYLVGQNRNDLGAFQRSFTEGRVDDETFVQLFSWLYRSLREALPPYHAVSKVYNPGDYAIRLAVTADSANGNFSTRHSQPTAFFWKGREVYAGLGSEAPIRYKDNDLPVTDDQGREVRINRPWTELVTLQNIQTGDLYSYHNLFFNDWFVAYDGGTGTFYRQEAEPYQERVYSMFVAWKDQQREGGSFSSEDLVFRQDKPDGGFSVYLAEDLAPDGRAVRAGARDLSSNIALAVFGQRVMENGEAVPVSEIVDQVEDRFQLRRFPQLVTRDADGRIVYGVAIGANESEGRMAEIEASDGFLALDISRYETEHPEVLAKLKDGTIGNAVFAWEPYRFVDLSAKAEITREDLKTGEFYIRDHKLYIKLFTYPYPGNALGITRSGQAVALVFPGDKMRGIGVPLQTLAREANRIYALEHGTDDPLAHVFLLANSKDANQWQITGGRLEAAVTSANAYAVSSAALMFEPLDRRELRAPEYGGLKFSYQRANRFVWEMLILKKIPKPDRWQVVEAINSEIETLTAMEAEPLRVRAMGAADPRSPLYKYLSVRDREIISSLVRQVPDSQRRAEGAESRAAAQRILQKGAWSDGQWKLAVDILAEAYARKLIAERAAVREQALSAPVEDREVRQVKMHNQQQTKSEFSAVFGLGRGVYEAEVFGGVSGQKLSAVLGETAPGRIAIWLLSEQNRSKPDESPRLQAVLTMDDWGLPERLALDAQGDVESDPAIREWLRDVRRRLEQFAGAWGLTLEDTVTLVREEMRDAWGAVFAKATLLAPEQLPELSRIAGTVHYSARNRALLIRDALTEYWEDRNQTPAVKLDPSALHQKFLEQMDQLAEAGLAQAESEAVARTSAYLKGFVELARLPAAQRRRYEDVVMGIRSLSHSPGADLTGYFSLVGYYATMLFDGLGVDVGPILDSLEAAFRHQGLIVVANESHLIAQRFTEVRNSFLLQALGPFESMGKIEAMAERFRIFTEDMQEVDRQIRSVETSSGAEFDDFRAVMDKTEKILPAQLAFMNGLSVGDPVNAEEMSQALAVKYGSAFDMPDEKLWIAGSRPQLMNLLGNLVSNANSFIPKAEGRVDVQIRREGKFAIVRVADNGPGISPLKLDKVILLDVSGRHDEAATEGRDVPEHGLGLAESIRIAEIHRGTFEIISQTSGAAVPSRLYRDGEEWKVAEAPEYAGEFPGGSGSLMIVRLPLTQAPGVTLVSPEEVPSSKRSEMRKAAAEAAAGRAATAYVSWQRRGRRDRESQEKFARMAVIGGRTDLARFADVFLEDLRKALAAVPGLEPEYLAATDAILEIIHSRIIPNLPDQKYPVAFEVPVSEENLAQKQFADIFSAALAKVGISRIEKMMPILPEGARFDGGLQSSLEREGLAKSKVQLLRSFYELSRQAKFYKGALPCILAGNEIGEAWAGFLPIGTQRGSYNPQNVHDFQNQVLRMAVQLAVALVAADPAVISPADLTVLEEVREGVSRSRRMNQTYVMPERLKQPVADISKKLLAQLQGYGLDASKVLGGFETGMVNFLMDHIEDFVSQYRAELRTQASA
ncbi:MAG: ATP-binding protein [Candidatus Omnitrophota bacterium]